MNRTNDFVEKAAEYVGSVMDEPSILEEAIPSGRRFPSGAELVAQFYITVGLMSEHTMENVKYAKSY